MSRLRIKNLEVGLTEIGLKPGVYTVGRDPANDYPIDHSSVSGFHCQLVVGEDAVRVIDLGSANGTFVNGRPVSEAMLTPAHSLRVGEVEMVYEIEPGLKLVRAGTGGAVTPTGDFNPPPPGGPSGAATGEASSLELVPRPSLAEDVSSPPLLAPCAKHPRAAAEYVCTNCRTRFCAACVYHWPGVARKYCPLCANLALPVPEYEALQRRLQEEARRLQQFWGNLATVFKYPLRRDGYILLAGGTVFFSLIQFMLRLAIKAGPFGIGALVLLPVLGYGYLMAYLFRVIQATTQGEDALPDWPDFSSWWDDIGAPTVQSIGIYLFCFGPLHVYFDILEHEPNRWIQCGLLAYGLLYFPMALLAVVMFETIAAVNPITVVSAVVKVPREYLLACAVFWGVAVCLLLGLFLSGLLTSTVFSLIFGPLPVVATVLATLLSLYLMTVEAHLLGRIHRTHAERLGWFKKPR